MFKSFTEIRDKLWTDIKANTTFTDGVSGALAYTLANVVARALRMVWFMLEQILNLFFVSTSKGSFLVRRCAERGVIQKIGTVAQGTVNLTRSTPAPVGAPLTQGTLLATLDGKLEFTVNQTITLPAGWTNVPADVTCITLGAAGNLAAGTPLQIVGAQVVGVQNIVVGGSGLSGGTNAETDAQLRARYLYTIQNPQNAGTPADYIVWTTSQTGVKQAVPLPLNRGNGTIDIVITDGGIPPDALVTTVQNYILTKCPVGADPRVIKPVAHPIPVTGAITAAQGYTNGTLIPLVKQAIQDYLATVPIGGVVRFSDIILAARGVKGVLDFSLTVPSGNTALAATELATAGALNIT